MILKPPKGAMLNRGHNLSRGMVGCWLFNEMAKAGGIIHDYSGNGHNGVVSGLASATPGKFGPAMDFQGVSGAGEVSIPGGVGSQLNGKLLTIVSWINWNQDNDTYPRIIDRTWNGQFAFYCHDLTNGVTWALSTVGGNKDLAGSGAPPITQGVWTQCCLVYDGNNGNIYVNGVLKQTYGTGISGGLSDSSGEIVIGERADGTGRLFDGQIDHIMIWDRALSASQIFSLYREPFQMFWVEM